MATLRLELEISAVDPSGEMAYVEGRGPGGVQVGLMIPASALAARIGQRLIVSVEAAQAASSVRERMSRATPAPAATSAPTTTPATRATGSAGQDMTNVVLSAILGSATSVERERDVEDEMDALFGRRR